MLRKLFAALVALLTVGILVMPMPGIAARTELWRQTHGGLPGQQVAGSVLPYFDSFGHVNLRAELLIGGAWVDITDRVRGPGGTSGFDIRYGQGELQSQSLAACTFTINNRDGLFSNRNPNSIYYGLLGRNTRIRVSVSDLYRFHGEITEFPQRWDRSGTDVFVPLVATGLLFRLGQGSKPLKSPLTRWYTEHTPTAWWALEGSLLANSAATSPMVIAASQFDPTIRQPVEVFTSPNVTGTASLMDLTKGSRLDASIPTHTSTGEYVIENVALFEPDPAGNFSTDIITVFFGKTTTLADVKVEADSNANPSVTITNTAGTTATVADTSRTVFDNRQRHYRTEIYQDGTGVTVLLYVDGELSVTNTMATETIGTAVSVSLNHPQEITPTPFQRFGQVAVFLDRDTPSGHEAASGYLGETAGARMARLCEENGIAFQIIGSADDTTTMGPQGIDTFLELLQECSAADAGVMYDPREFFGIAYRTRASLYNQVGPELDYSAAELSETPEPVEDDPSITNNFEARRQDGGSATYVLDEGTMSVQDPPDGIGVYEGGDTYNVETDEQLPDLASERVIQSTWDEARHPVVGVNFARSNFRDDISLTNSIAGLNAGSALSITNPPEWLPPDDIRVVVWGYGERVTGFIWTMIFNSTPAGPYDAFLILGDDTLSTEVIAKFGLWAPDENTLGVAAAPSDVALTVVTPADKPILSIDVSDYPVDLIIAGERVRATECSGASSPQTLTVARAVNGISKTLPAGSALQLYPDVRISR